MKAIKTMIAVIAMIMATSAANAQSNNNGNDDYSCFSVKGVFDTEFGQNPLPIGSTYTLNIRHPVSIRILDDHTFKIFLKDLVYDGIEFAYEIGQYYEITPGMYRFEYSDLPDYFFLDGEDLVTTKCERWYRE